jgi:hypothetical protein
MKEGDYPVLTFVIQSHRGGTGGAALYQKPSGTFAFSQSSSVQLGYSPGSRRENLRVDPVLFSQLVQALLTMLQCSTYCRCRAGAST